MQSTSKGKSGNKIRKAGISRQVGKFSCSEIRHSPRFGSSISASSASQNVNQNGEETIRDGEGDQDQDDDAVDDDAPGAQQESSAVSRLFLEVPKAHRLVCIKSVSTNGVNQRTCSTPHCNKRPNKFCWECSDFIPGTKDRLVCFCYDHFPFHIASQCYKAYIKHVKQTVVDVDVNDDVEENE